MKCALLEGDCLEQMKNLPDNSIDSVVTDPPYGLGQVKDLPALLSAWMNDEDDSHAVGKNGFMGKEWDKSVPSPKIWKECLRVLKPGGHMLVFAGTRTQDLIGISIRLAGFELRDEISYFGNLHWVYGSGFPKSHNISKAIDKKLGAEREVVGVKKLVDGSDARKTAKFTNHSENISGFKDGGNLETLPSSDKAKKWDGWGTALKPAHEPILMFRKPLSEKTVASNVLKHGTGGINIDDCRISTSEQLGHEQKDGPMSPKYGFNNNSMGNKFQEGSPKGRFPANIIHDGSEEVEECFPDSKGQCGDLKNHNKDRQSPNGVSGKMKPSSDCLKRNDSGSASRFFYCAKVSKKERNEGCEDLENKESPKRDDGQPYGMNTNKYRPDGSLRKEVQPKKNNHPTVKPVELMKYLVRLVTPKQGKVLDPFMGSGSTGKACVIEDFDFIGIEKDAEYVEIAKLRIKNSKEK